MKTPSNSKAFWFVWLVAMLSTCLLPGAIQDSRPQPIPITEPEPMTTIPPFTEGLRGDELKAALEDAIRTAMSFTEQAEFPSSPFQGQTVRVTNPTGASAGTYRWNETLAQWLPLWYESPYQITELQVIDQDLIIWSAAEPVSPGDVIVNISEYSYFELLLSADITITLPDAGGVQAQKPLIFHNKAVGQTDTIKATFQNQQFPVGNDDKTTPYGLDMDLELYPGELVVLVSDGGVNGRWLVLHERRNSAISITNADSPFQVKWWHRKILADASGGAVTVNLPGPGAGGTDPGQVNDYEVMNVGASGTVTVVPGVGTLNGAANDPIATQWAGGRYFSDGANWFKAP